MAPVIHGGSLDSNLVRALGAKLGYVKKSGGKAFYLPVGIMIRVNNNNNNNNFSLTSALQCLATVSNITWNYK